MRNAWNLAAIKGLPFSIALTFAVMPPQPITRADPPAKMTIRWHGQSFFELQSSKGTRIVFDPHAIEAYGRVDISADLILISHFHNDHDQKEVVRNLARAKVVEGLRRDGRKLDWNLIDQTFRDVHIRTVGVYHDDVEGMERGKNAVFILEVDGLRIVHLGDLGHLLTEKQVKAIGPVDVLMIPVGGVYTINGAEAKQVVEQLKPSRYILPMHYGTKVFEDLLPADEFLEDQKNVKKFPGNKITIETDFKPPEPIIAILDWKN
jgi:L-ascorbate metabolism protein UlaG (beta-lactamase superfamily)